MKIIADSKALAELASITASVIKRHPNPALACTRLRATGGKAGSTLVASATCGEVWVRGESAQMDVLSAGDVLVEAARLSSVCDSLKDESSVTLEVVSERLKVSGNRSEFHLPIVMGDAPSFGETKEKPLWTHDAPGEELCAALGRVVFAIDASRAGVKGAIQGVLIEREKGELRCVATNGVVIGMYGPKPNGTVPHSIIVPHAAVRLVMRTFQETKEVATLSAFENRCEVAISGGWTIGSLLVEGTFPPFRSIMETQFGEPATVDRESAIAAVRSVSLMPSPHTNSVGLEFDEKSKRLNVSGGTAEGGTSLASCDAEMVAPEAWSLAINSKYTAEALSSMTSVVAGIRRSIGSRVLIVRIDGAAGEVAVIATCKKE